MRKTRIILMLLFILEGLVLVPTVRADGPTPEPHPPPVTPPPGPTSTPEPEDGDGGDEDEDGDNIITRIIKHILLFPVENLAAAVKGLIEGMLEGVGGWILDPFRSAVRRAVKLPDLENDPDGIFRPTWVAMRTVAIAIWPLTLGILAALAARSTAVGSAWGLDDAKTNLTNWLVAALLTYFSYTLLSFFNRFINAVTNTIFAETMGGSLEETIATAATIIITPAAFLAPLGAVGIAWGVIASIFMLAIGIAVLVALIMQYVARYGLLVVLVGLAPLVLSLTVLPPLTWLKWLWLKGLVLVELLGPVNVILLKLVVAASNQIGGGFTNVLVNFLITVGYLGLIITVDSMVIRTFFGGIMAVIHQAMGALKAVGVLAVAAVGGAAAGGLAGAAGAASGAGTAGAGISTGAPVAAAGTGAASQGIGKGLPAAAGPSAGAQGMRQYLTAQQKRGAGLRAAGNIMRSGLGTGLGGAVGSLMSQTGGQMERAAQAGADMQTQGQWEDIARKAGFGPGTKEGREITGALGQLGGRYGSAPVAKAAQEGLASVRAAHGQGLSLNDMARSQGYTTPRDFIGGNVESVLQARGLVPIGQRAFSPSGQPSPSPGLSFPDFARGGELAGTLGVPGDLGHASAITPYAQLHYMARSQGQKQVSALFDTAAYARRQAAGSGVSQLTPTQSALAQGIFARSLPGQLGWAPSGMPREFRPLMEQYAPVRSMPGLDTLAVMQGQNIADALGVPLEPQAVRPFAELYQTFSRPEYGGEEAAQGLVDAAWGARRQIGRGEELDAHTSMETQSFFYDRVQSMIDEREMRESAPPDLWDNLLRGLVGSLGRPPKGHGNE